MPPKEVASVARPDERQARQVLDARLLVESEVVRQLPAGLDPAALAELRALVDEEQACLAARDSAGLIRLAGRFHLRLAELTENPLLQGFVRGLVARASLDIALNKGAVYTAEARARRALLDALEDGDSAAAAALMDAYPRGLFARMRFLPPPTTDLREAFGMKAPRGKNAGGPDLGRRLPDLAGGGWWPAYSEAGQGWRRAGRSSQGSVVSARSCP